MHASFNFSHLNSTHTKLWYFGLYAIHQKSHPALKNKIKTKIIWVKFVLCFWTLKQIHSCVFVFIFIFIFIFDHVRNLCGEKSIRKKIQCSEMWGRKNSLNTKITQKIKILKVKMMHWFLIIAIINKISPKKIIITIPWRKVTYLLMK